MFAFARVAFAPRDRARGARERARRRSVRWTRARDGRAGIERVRLREDGWNAWTWRGHACNYTLAGEGNDGPIVTLVHGFGAHSYHWRYTIPALARAGYRVYALCMLGYGWSPKVEEEYCMEFWGEQVVDFSREVAGASEEDKTIIVGNSIGALAALYAASTRLAARVGVVSVNSASGISEPGRRAWTGRRRLWRRARWATPKTGDGKTAESFFAG